MVRIILTIAILACIQALKVKEVSFDPSVDDAANVTAVPTLEPDKEPNEQQTLEDIQDEQLKSENDMYSCLIELNQNIFNPSYRFISTAFTDAKTQRAMQIRAVFSPVHQAHNQLFPNTQLVRSASFQFFERVGFIQYGCHFFKCKS